MNAELRLMSYELLVFYFFPGFEHFSLLKAVGLDLAQRLDFAECIVTFLRKRLIQGRSFRFPGDHFVRNLLDDRRRISYHEASFGDLHLGRHKSQRANNTFILDHCIVHDHAVHADQAVLADNSAMNDRSVADVRAFFEDRGRARKHVHRTVLLHIAAIFNDDLPPVAADGCARADVNVFANDDIARNRCIRMHKTTFLDDRNKSVELKNCHGTFFFKSTKFSCNFELYIPTENMSYCKFCAAKDRQEVNRFYHDNHYGFPIESDDELFGRLILEINQAGLSWQTILNKQDNFREVFDGFSIAKIATYDDAKVDELMQNAGIIRNKLKVNAVIHNAQRVLALQEEFGSFLNWLNHNDSKSKEEWLKLFKKNFKFVGGEIVGEFLMSSGYLKGAHEESCPIFDKVLLAQPNWLKYN